MSVTLVYGAKRYSPSILLIARACLTGLLRCFDSGFNSDGTVNGTGDSRGGFGLAIGYGRNNEGQSGGTYWSL
jgi:hypothetical protein